MTGSEPGWCGLGGGPDRKSLASSFDNGKPDVVAAWPKDGAPVAVDPLKTPTDASDSTFDKLLRSTVELLTERRDKDRRNWWPRFQPVIVGDLAIVRTVGMS